jgi:hypothetical protein
LSQLVPSYWIGRQPYLLNRILHDRITYMSIIIQQDATVYGCISLDNYWHIFMMHWPLNVKQNNFFKKVVIMDSTEELDYNSVHFINMVYEHIKCFSPCIWTSWTGWWCCCLIMTNNFHSSVLSLWLKGGCELEISSGHENSPVKLLPVKIM